MQLGLPPETNVNKKRGSNWTTEEEILLIEEVLKYEGTLFGKMKGSGGGGGGGGGEKKGRVGGEDRATQYN